MADVEKIAVELREAARPINGWAKPGRADLMLRAADELDRLREERDMWKGRAEAAVMIGRSLTGARALSTQVEERE